MKKAPVREETAPPRPDPLFSAVHSWLLAPQAILRLELIRILLPLAVLGFMAGRVAHADEWFGTGGFRVPELPGDDWRQPLYIPPIPNVAAWAVGATIVVSGLFVSAGFRTRWAALVFSMALAFAALSDRLAAFTVSKASPILAFALFASPAGARYGIDAYLRFKKNPKAYLPTHVASGALRFFQAFLVVMYTASGLCKARKDWLSHGYVLFTHVHDSYQTGFSWLLANAMPAFMWTVLQGVVLALELFAPVWFIWNKSRNVALVLALGMHAMIGLMFDPVKWFAMMMMVILFGSFASDSVLARIERAIAERFSGGSLRRAG